MLWIAATLIAAVAQTARNAAQRQLTGEVGTMGATAVRFIFGAPFAILLLGPLALHQALPLPGTGTLLWACAGALSQIGATALMLQAMRSRGFGVITALMKTEPVTLAILGAIILAEPLGPLRMAAIAVATAGVLLMSGADLRRGSLGPALLGIGSGVLFGLSAIGFRGAILALPDGDFLTRAGTVLAISLTMQAALTLIWLAVTDRQALAGIARHWRHSVGAGFLGAFASLFWFIGFALTPAANVRTLALVEVVLAQIVSGRLMRQETTPRQIAGMALIVAGVGALILASR
ncbi:DMT family transporter [Paracoccus sp. DMF-8]|uniref:DMT family transporter n=1 Tax=Paracoccus sp. DMF-8 TaxID=3019445 RepID=UPI0023E7EC45|nr:DMT family transporter [Paracoccus sp. DMF-8]MDF3606028.1 DMT family transporter [Paracoccus sp. DMF-8]